MITTVRMLTLDFILPYLPSGHSSPP